MCNHKNKLKLFAQMCDLKDNNMTNMFVCSTCKKIVYKKSLSALSKISTDVLVKESKGIYTGVLYD